METDWIGLWRELTIANPHTSYSDSARRYKTRACQRRQRLDPLLDFVLKSIDSRMTVLDIGAGDGRWTIPLARLAGAVTAVEPSEDMLEALRENIKTAPVNIKIIQSLWEETDVEDQDIVVCAHAMYSSPDFTLFVRKMEQHARRACYLALRLPSADGVIGELAKAIYGRIYDSPNAVIAYNALYSLGIYANVLVENDIYRWVNDTLEEAFFRAKRHLHLGETGAYDELIRDTLRQRLILADGRYLWPDGMRSALLWWHPSTITKHAER